LRLRAKPQGAGKNEIKDIQPLQCRSQERPAVFGRRHIELVIDAATRKLARRRASRRYEFCGLHEDDDPLFAFHVEHIVARHHGVDPTFRTTAACTISLRLVVEKLGLLHLAALARRQGKGR
jgi:hypothetical protein